MSIANSIAVPMFTLRSSGLAILFATSACLSEPTFVAASDEPSSSASGEKEMALVPATTLGDVVQPSGKPKEDKPPKGGGKGKGGGGEPADDSSGPGPGGEPAPEPGGDPSPPGMLVPSFWIDLREVSASDYGACVSAGACTAQGAAPGCTSAASLGDHPANCVAKAQAVAYCTWRNKRLLRSEEWSAAASGSPGRPFVWGTDAPAAAFLNACGSECAAGGMYAADDGFATTAPVGSFPGGRTPEGVFDLAGNVAEWVEAPGGVVRGGSYADRAPADVAVGASRSVGPDTVDPTIGFRCARDI